jgi:hypothetical protein
MDPFIAKWVELVVPYLAIIILIVLEALLLFDKQLIVSTKNDAAEEYGIKALTIGSMLLFMGIAWFKNSPQVVTPLIASTTILFVTNTYAQIAALIAGAVYMITRETSEHSTGTSSLIALLIAFHSSIHPAIYIISLLFAGSYSGLDCLSAFERNAKSIAALVAFITTVFIGVKATNPKKTHFDAILVMTLVVASLWSITWDKPNIGVGAGEMKSTVNKLFGAFLGLSTLIYTLSHFSASTFYKVGFGAIFAAAAYAVFTQRETLKNGVPVSQMKYAAYDATSFIKNEIRNTGRNSLILLVLTIAAFSLYFGVPIVKEKIKLQGGKELLKEPVYLNSLKKLGGYQEMNGTDEYNYQYGLACQIYIDSNNTGSYTVLDYGYKPNISYDATTNKLTIRVEDRIVYEQEHFPLQKWHNVVINYNNGTLDVFMNGDLVKSVEGVVPYMRYDVLTVGEDNGLNGGVRNVVYYKKPLTATNLYFL